MRVLVVGSGGREHALCWGLRKSPQVAALYCAPGNAGIAEVAECVAVGVDALDALVDWAKTNRIDFVVIGPEAPLVAGLVDRLEAAGIAAFGPTKAAAELEGSKGFTKDLCRANGIPTAAYERFTDVAAAKAYIRRQGAPIVIKYDGLAAGKGVTVAQSVDEAIAAVDRVGAPLVVEECLVGEEASFHALTDGSTVLSLPTAQDHKAVGDGDTGANTGGMGAYSPAPVMTEAMNRRARDEILLPTVRAMAAMGRPFKGVLYAGLMITADGPKLIEYNCRFGDPECQVMLPRLQSDLLPLLWATRAGGLDRVAPIWRSEAALCVVMAAKGYPEAPRNGGTIAGLERAGAQPGALVFHAGTRRRADGAIVADGGRVLGVTALGRDVAEAQARAYRAVDAIEFPEGFCRRDIGYRAVARLRGATADKGR
ncbi:MAG: phosphoribosylamine--glycine ligase [Alphaproteobacteria bacterium]|nr:phosphoribosylamine--glycine ligase [Alphaproteobacteria bacterium]